MSDAERLRDDLIAQYPEKDRIARLQTMAEDIVTRIDTGQDCTSEINEMGAFTRHEGFDRDYFQTLHAHSSIDDFAEMAALPPARHVPGLSRGELIDIVRRIIFAEGWSCDYYMALLDLNVPLQGASSLIFHPPEDFDGEIGLYDPTPEEIVDRALSPGTTVHL